MARVFKAPKFELFEKRTEEIPFSGTIAAGAHLTMLSGSISYPFRVLQATMVFTNDADNNIRVYWLVSHEISTSTTAVPTGTYIFGRGSPTPYFVGKATVKRAYGNVKFEEAGLYIKCHVHNNGPYPYDFSGSITIQEV